jgi:hypothetical protein
MNCGDGPEFSSKGKHWVLFGCEPDVDSSNLFSVPDNLYMVHPNGTGLEQLTHTDADKHYVGSSFSPEFHNGWGDIVAARYNTYRDEGTLDLFHMHVDTGGVSPPSVNLTKSETLNDHPSCGTHPPSLKTLYKRGCAPVPREPDEASKCY